MVIKLKIKARGKMLEIGFEGGIYKVPLKLLKTFEDGAKGIERERINKLIDEMPNYLHKKDLIDRQKLKSEINKK